MPPTSDQAQSPATRYGNHGSSRAYLALLVTAAALVVVLSALRASVFWPNEAFLDDASGNWTALAKDLTEGVFYRPLQSPAGYGGSRYFPLHFVLHAGFMTLLGDPIRSGFAVSALSMTLLVAGVYTWLRRLGATPVVAAACAAFVLATSPAQEALLAIKGDGLAAALNVWGVALCAGGTLGPGGIAAAAILFTSAFAAKMVMVSGLGASVLWLWLSGRKKTAAQLLVATAAGIALVLVLIQLASHGVAFEVLRASASGGAGAGDILKAPFTLARQARRVPETLAFIQLGCAALLVLLFQSKRLANLPLLFFVSVLGVTTVIFGSPGTDTNHFLDLHVASVVLVASWLVAQGFPQAAFGGAALVVAALAASLSLASGLADARAAERHGLFADALRLIPDKSRPILAQNPLVGVAAGQRAYVLDPFMIRLFTERSPERVEPLWSDLRSQKFAAVVFENDPRAERTKELYRVILGARFLDEVERSYEITGSIGTRTVYLPRSR